MPTKTEKSAEQPAQQETADTPSHAILFQLEDVAVSGRKTAYDVLTGLLKKHKMVFAPGLFAKHGLSSPPPSYLPALMSTAGADAARAQQLADEAVEEIHAKLRKAGEPHPLLEKILKAAQDQHIACGAVTALPEEKADDLLSKLGLAKLGVELFAYKDVDEDFPGPNTWLKAAKAMGQNPMHCSVLAGNMTSCKAALSADMRCVVLPDEFTSFQDYSGADMVIEDGDDVTAREVLVALFPVAK